MLRKISTGRNGRHNRRNPGRQMIRTVCKAQDECQSRTDNSFVASYLLHSCLFVQCVARGRVSLPSKTRHHPRCVSFFTPARIETSVLGLATPSDRLNLFLCPSLHIH
jgi:hypothetical protein